MYVCMYVCMYVSLFETPKVTQKVTRTLYPIRKDLYTQYRLRSVRSVRGLLSSVLPEAVPPVQFFWKIPGPMVIAMKDFQRECFTIKRKNDLLFICGKGSGKYDSSRRDEHFHLNK